MKEPQKDDKNLQEQKHEKIPFSTIRIRYLRTKRYEKANQKRINYNHESNNKTQS